MIIVDKDRIVYGYNSKAVNKFLEKYPLVAKSMGPVIKKYGVKGLKLNVRAAYAHWIRTYDETALGARAKFVSAPSFGEKTFYKFEWNGVSGFACVFTALWEVA